ncbi:patatin-like protein [Eilatimonas milleporae]|uniref:Patatin-related protein n=1 Tax=Eilatimonas milleporae TaxID=911205 RepID=A0A3M0BWJ4_9PROT|nr:patatin-like protein [Eilatimonas milleporae]RMB01472.1 patatin-related protein [Eilatimonas milleporae]
MRELELRLGLVCFGGVSLAVYMSGVSNEILKLIKASRRFHAPGGAAETPLRDGCNGTEELYVSLLQALAPRVRLRVILDAISGASAGGINGIFLARAVAHDLSLEPLRRMWFELGDIEQLMNEETHARRFSKAYLYPLFWAFRKSLYPEIPEGSETRRKLNRFLRSRWFNPPFSGDRMLSWMFDAGAAMGKAPDHMSDWKQSLLPPGHRLDLFVSLTNFHGQHRRLSLHDPAEIIETQHQVTLGFSHMQPVSAVGMSDFTDANLAGLAFAARATSSFPGAFPAVTLNDVERLLRERGAGWSHKNAFLKRNFSIFLEDRTRLEALHAMSFIDGSVTNNKPFQAVMQAIHDRPAHREVDRRIIYVDPNPAEPAHFLKGSVPPPPGFFRNILSSIAEIPRMEPIYENLRGIARMNRDNRRLETVLHAVEADVAAHVDEMVAPLSLSTMQPDRLADWRMRAYRLARMQAGYSYGTYREAKRVRLVERLSKLLDALAREYGHDKRAGDWHGPLYRWTSVPLSEKPASASSLEETADDGFADMMRAFDVDFRIRRIRFVIRRLNAFLPRYRHQDGAQAILSVKQRLYEHLEAYKTLWQPDVYRDDPGMAGAFEKACTYDGPEDLLAMLGRCMGLAERDAGVDGIMAECMRTLPGDSLGLGLFRAYVGFGFFDVAILPLKAQPDLLELDEVRVDRISPQDCSGFDLPVLTADSDHPLMGTRLQNFGAFFSRRARENDYLWGRLHAASRLLDFLLDAAGPDALPDGFDARHFRQRLFRSIVEAEAADMTQAQDLVRRLRRELGG